MSRAYAPRDWTALAVSIAQWGRELGFQEIGIADTDLPHIFEPFFSTKAEGSGIGLALVYRVAQDHGGHVEVRSAPSAGATFTLTLPSTDGAV